MEGKPTDDGRIYAGELFSSRNLGCGAGRLSWECLLAKSIKRKLGQRHIREEKQSVVPLVIAGGFTEIQNTDTQQLRFIEIR